MVDDDGRDDDVDLVVGVAVVETPVDGRTGSVVDVVVMVVVAVGRRPVVAVDTDGSRDPVVEGTTSTVWSVPEPEAVVGEPEADPVEAVEPDVAPLEEPVDVEPIEEGEADDGAPGTVISVSAAGESRLSSSVASVPWLGRGPAARLVDPSTTVAATMACSAPGPDPESTRPAQFDPSTNTAPAATRPTMPTATAARPRRRRLPRPRPGNHGTNRDVSRRSTGFHLSAGGRGAASAEGAEAIARLRIECAGVGRRGADDAQGTGIVMETQRRRAGPRGAGSRQ